MSTSYFVFNMLSPLCAIIHSLIFFYLLKNLQSTKHICVFFSVLNNVISEWHICCVSLLQLLFYIRYIWMVVKYSIKIYTIIAIKRIIHHSYYNKHLNIRDVHIWDVSVCLCCCIFQCCYYCYSYLFQTSLFFFIFIFYFPSVLRFVSFSNRFSHCLCIKCVYVSHTLSPIVSICA